MQPLPAASTVITAFVRSVLGTFVLYAADGIDRLIRPGCISQHGRLPISDLLCLGELTSGLDQSVTALFFKSAGEDGYDCPMQVSAIKVDGCGDFIIFLDSHHHCVIDTHFVQFRLSMTRACNLLCLCHQLIPFYL